MYHKKYLYLFCSFLFILLILMNMTVNHQIIDNKVNHYLDLGISSRFHYCLKENELVEITPMESVPVSKYRVFYHEEDHQAYLLCGSDVYLLGNNENVAFYDLNQDGYPEILFMDTSGSGILYQSIHVIDLRTMLPMTIEYSNQMKHESMYGYLRGPLILNKTRTDVAELYTFQYSVNKNAFDPISIETQQIGILKFENDHISFMTQS